MGSDPPQWVADAIAYQIFPDRFAASPRVHKPGPLEPWDAPPTRHGFKGGDLLGIVEHLDHLAELGVNTISLNPVFASASNHRYHTYDYRSVDPLLGGDAALRQLLDAAHARGLRVILDGVFNHASRGFWPFNHVLENGAASPYIGWFFLNPDWLASGRRLRAFDETNPPASLEADWASAHAPGTESLSTLGYRAWWDLPALPKLNTENPEVREFLYETGAHWIRFGADGWRLDVAAEIDTEGFWQEFRSRVRAVNPDAYLVAEVWEERPDLLSGDSFDALMNYPLLCAIVGFAAGRHLDTDLTARHAWLSRHLTPLDGPAFADRLTHLANVYRPQVRDAMLNLVGGHDTPRLRSMGTGDRATVQLAILALMTLPGVPCVYYGDEIGLQGGVDPGSRGAFPWDAGTWDREIHGHVRDAIALRQAVPLLRRGGLLVLAARDSAIAWLRHWETARQPAAAAAGDPGSVLVGLNSGEGLASLELENPALADRAFTPLSLSRTCEAADLPALRTDGTGRLTLTIPPRAGIVLRSAGSP